MECSRVQASRAIHTGGVSATEAPVERKERMSQMQRLSNDGIYHLKADPSVIGIIGIISSLRIATGIAGHF